MAEDLYLPDVVSLLRITPATRILGDSACYSEYLGALIQQKYHGMVGARRAVGGRVGTSVVDTDIRIVHVFVLSYTPYFHIVE